MNLKRGVPVIMNDVDAPEARLVAVLTSYDDARGVWHARYLSTFPHRARCSSHSWTPTPIAAFGVRLELDGFRFRCVPTGEPCRATYDDGKPRSWQDRAPERWQQIRVKAAAFLVEPEATP